MPTISLFLSLRASFTEVQSETSVPVLYSKIKAFVLDLLYDVTCDDVNVIIECKQCEYGKCEQSECEHTECETSECEQSKVSVRREADEKHLLNKLITAVCIYRLFIYI